MDFPRFASLFLYPSISLPVVVASRVTVRARGFQSAYTGAAEPAVQLVAGLERAASRRLLRLLLSRERSAAGLPDAADDEHVRQ